MTPEVTPNSGRREKRLIVKETEGQRKHAYLDGVQLKVHVAKVFPHQIEFMFGGSKSKLMSISLREIDDSIVLLYGRDYKLGISNVTCNLTFRKTTDKWLLSLRFNFASHKWKKPWSIEDFDREWFELIDEKEYAPIEKSRLSQSLLLYISNQDAILQEQINIYRDKILYLYNETERRLQAKLDENSLLTYFKFHPAFQGACEEYLWSFIQFLRDMGVEAEGKLEQDKEHPGQVLFAVTPAKGKEALGKIQQALDLYIALAGVTNFDSKEEPSIQIERLQIRIERFQTDLRMAKLEYSTLEAKASAHESEIRALKTIELGLTVALKDTNATNVFLCKRIEELEKKKKIDFFNGVIVLENPKLGVVSVDLAKLLPHLKRLLHEEGPPELPASPERPTLLPASEE